MFSVQNRLNHIPLGLPSIHLYSSNDTQFKCKLDRTVRVESTKHEFTVDYKSNIVMHSNTLLNANFHCYICLLQVACFTDGSRFES